MNMKIFKFREVLPQLPNLLVRRRFRFEFEMLPFEAEQIRLKKLGNFFLAGLNQFLLPSKPLGFPVIAQVEPANFCNLSCPLCLTTSQTRSRPRKLLERARFQEFIDEIGDFLLLIVLWNWGEPFLNPDIFKMIAYAKSKHIMVHSSTNGNVQFGEERAAQLVESGLDSLVFGVDGATQQSYSAYRKDGDLDVVLENIRTIVRAKKKKRSEKPRLNLRFVVMKDNEHEIPAMRELARQLEVDFFTLKTVDMPPSLGQGLDGEYAPGEEKYQRYEYRAGGFERKNQHFVCMRPWKRITLDALGEVIPCEYDYKDAHSFGNIRTEESVMKAWKSDGARDFRERFDLGNNGFYLCRDCTYKNSKGDDCTVEKISVGRI